MPTTHIIGYLWNHRKALDIQSIPDMLQLMSDLQRNGCEVVRVEDVVVLGKPIGATSVSWVSLTDEEWAERIEEAILKGAIEHTIHMLHRGDGE